MAWSMRLAGAGVLEATLYLREAVQGQQRNSRIILSNYSITQTVLSHINPIVRLNMDANGRVR